MATAGQDRELFVVVGHQRGARGDVGRAWAGGNVGEELRPMTGPGRCVGVGLAAWCLAIRSVALRGNPAVGQNGDHGSIVKGTQYVCNTEYRGLQL